MKTKHIFGILLLCLCNITFVNCNKENEKYYSSIPGGGFAYRANAVHFYYVDKAGNSLIDADNLETYPIPCNSKNTKPDVLELRVNGYYGEYSCQIGKDQEGKTYFTTSAPIDQSTNKYTFFVYSEDTFDQFDLAYGYRPDAVGGNGWSATILSWKINGKHVYSDEDNSKKKDIKIYIQKENGETKIWTE